MIESITLLMSAQGTVLRADVAGTLHIKSFLSGMPECRIGLNDKIVLEKEYAKSNKARKKRSAIALDDCTFHQCVRLNKFDTERVISFVPPDGEFDLMKYRTTKNTYLPFKVIPNVREVGTTKVEIQVNVRSTFPAQRFATGVAVLIPCPSNTAGVKIKASSGKAAYVPEKGGIMWTMKRFPGKTEVTLSADVELISRTKRGKAWSRPPISMAFSVEFFTASGLDVRYLKVVEKSGYTSEKYVRFLTTSRFATEADTQSAKKNKKDQDQSAEGAYEIRTR